MEWSNENEEIAQSIGLEAQILYMAHTDCYNDYRKKSLYFLFPTILISSVIGGLGFSESFTSNETNKFILGGFNIFIAILNSLYRLCNIQDNENQHYLLSRLWYMLYEKIRIELQKNPNNREDCNSFIQSIADLKMSLIEKNVLLNREIIKKYRMKYKDKINLPLSLKHLSPIIIYNQGINTPLTPSSIETVI
jgi:hypothetical protein